MVVMVGNSEKDRWLRKLNELQKHKEWLNILTQKFSKEVEVIFKNSHKNM